MEECYFRKMPRPEEGIGLGHHGNSGYTHQYRAAAMTLALVVGERECARLHNGASIAPSRPGAVEPESDRAPFRSACSLPLALLMHRPAVHRLSSTSRTTRSAISLCSGVPTVILIQVW